MLKNSPMLTVIISVSAIIFLFHVKYEVSALEKKNSYLKKNIALLQDDIHILNAEWHHLNDPKRLQTLTKKYLTNLRPTDSKQLISIESFVNNKKITGIEDHDAKLDEFMNSVLT